MRGRLPSAFPADAGLFFICGVLRRRSVPVRLIIAIRCDERDKDGDGDHDRHHQHIPDARNQNRQPDHDKAGDHQRDPAEALGFLPDGVIRHAPFGAQAERGIPPRLRHEIAERNERCADADRREFVDAVKADARAVAGAHRQRHKKEAQGGEKHQRDHAGIQQHFFVCGVAARACLPGNHPEKHAHACGEEGKEQKLIFAADAVDLAGEIVVHRHPVRRQNQEHGCAGRAEHDENVQNGIQLFHGVSPRKSFSQSSASSSTEAFSS